MDMIRGKRSLVKSSFPHIKRLWVVGLPGKFSGLDICFVLLYFHGEIFLEEKRKKTKLDLGSL